MSIRVRVLGNYTATDTIVRLEPGDGAKLPDTQSYGPFALRWYNAQYQVPTDDPNCEDVVVSVRIDDILYVQRGSYGTSAHEHTGPYGTWSQHFMSTYDPNDARDWANVQMNTMRGASSWADLSELTHRIGTLEVALGVSNTYTAPETVTALPGQIQSGVTTDVTMAGLRVNFKNRFLATPEFLFARGYVTGGVVEVGVSEVSLGGFMLKTPVTATVEWAFKGSLSFVSFPRNYLRVLTNIPLIGSNCIFPERFNTVLHATGDYVVYVECWKDKEALTFTLNRYPDYVKIAPYLAGATAKVIVYGRTQ